MFNCECWIVPFFHYVYANYGVIMFNCECWLIPFFHGFTHIFKELLQLLVSELSRFLLSGLICRDGREHLWIGTIRPAWPALRLLIRRHFELLERSQVKSSLFIPTARPVSYRAADPLFTITFQMCCHMHQVKVKLERNTYSSCIHE